MGKNVIFINKSRQVAIGPIHNHYILNSNKNKKPSAEGVGDWVF